MGSTTSDDWELERRSLQEGVSARAVQLEVLEEAYRSALWLAEANGWSEADALRIVFDSGLAFLTGEASVSKIQRSDLPQQVLDDLNRVLRQLQEESSRYASLKFKAYRMSQDNETLTMRESGLRGELELAKHRLALFRRDEEGLKQRLTALEAENATLRQRLASVEGEPTGEATPRRWGWVARFLPGAGRARRAE